MAAFLIWFASVERNRRAPERTDVCFNYTGLNRILRAEPAIRSIRNLGLPIQESAPAG